MKKERDEIKNDLSESITDVSNVGIFLFTDNCNCGLFTLRQFMFVGLLFGCLRKGLF